jgi:hypothetical protein
VEGRISDSPSNSSATIGSATTSDQMNVQREIIRRAAAVRGGGGVLGAGGLASERSPT